MGVTKLGVRKLSKFVALGEGVQQVCGLWNITINKGRPQETSLRGFGYRLFSW